MKIKFEPRDIWIGLYWDKIEETWLTPVAKLCRYRFYLCVVPMLPIIWEMKVVK